MRERLRKRLRRSPDPDEFFFEMARDKGYGGRFKEKKRKRNAQRLLEDNGPLLFDGKCRTDPFGDAFDDDSANGEGEQQNNSEDGCENDEARRGREQGHLLVTEGRAMTLSTEEIAGHPLVKSLMQRLEALEGRGKAPEVATQNLEEAQIRSIGDDEGGVGQSNGNEVEVCMFF